MGFFELAGAVFHHIFQPARDFFLLPALLGNVPADMDELGDPSAPFPNGVNVHLVVADFTVRKSPLLHPANRLLVTHHLLQGAVAGRQVAESFLLVIDLEAFPADHLVAGISHLLQKRVVGLDHVHVRRHDQDKVLDPVDQRLHLARAFPQFALLAADGLPEDSEHGVGQDADAGRPGGEDIFEHARVGRQNDDEVDLVPGIVEVAGNPQRSAGPIAGPGEPPGWMGPGRRRRRSALRLPPA